MNWPTMTNKSSAPFHQPPSVSIRAVARVQAKEARHHPVAIMPPPATVPKKSFAARQTMPAPPIPAFRRLPPPLSGAVATAQTMAMALPTHNRMMSPSPVPKGLRPSLQIVAAQPSFAVRSMSIQCTETVELPGWINKIKAGSCVMLSNKIIPEEKLIGVDLGNSESHYMVCVKKSGNILTFIVTSSKEKKDFLELDDQEPFKKKTYLSKLKFTVATEDIFKVQKSVTKVTQLQKLTNVPTQ